MPYTPNNPYIAGDPYSYDLKWVVERLKALKNEITQLEKTYTTPTVVETAAEFNDRNKIFVYMGSELGYNYGHWYYYDPDTNLWTDGGLYGSITPDVAIDITSTNAVENKAIATALNTKLNIADIDSSLDASSTNPVQNKIIDAALNDKQDALTIPLPLSDGGTGATTPANARTNLEIRSVLLESGVRTGEHTEWGAMNYVALVIEGVAGNGVDRNTITIPTAAITSSNKRYFIADGSNYIDFAVRSSGSNVIIGSVQSSIADKTIDIYGIM